MNPGRKFNYGYVVVAVAFMFMVIIFGVNYNFGVFFDYIQTEFGWKRGAISGAYSLMTVTSGVLSIFMGRLSDRKGPFTAALLITISAAGGYILLSTIQSIYTFYLYHLIICIALGGSWTALLPQISYYFTKNRGMMVGVATAGIGASSLIIAPITRIMIEALGWRSTYLISGIVFLVLLGIGNLLLKNAPKYRPRRIPQSDAPSGDIPGETLKQALHSKNFYRICLIFFLFCYILHAVMVHIIPYALDMGFAAQAIRIVALIGGISLFTRILGSWLSDKIGMAKTMILAGILMALGFMVILLPAQLFLLTLFGILFGVAYGGGMSLLAIAAADYYGPKAAGAVIGGINSLAAIGSALGPLVTGLIFDVCHSYKPAFAIMLVFAIICIIMCFRLTPPRYRAQ